MVPGLQAVACAPAYAQHLADREGVLPRPLVFIVVRPILKVLHTQTDKCEGTVSLHTGTLSAAEHELHHEQRSRLALCTEPPEACAGAQHLMDAQSIVPGNLLRAAGLRPCTADFPIISGCGRAQAD